MSPRRSGHAGCGLLAFTALVLCSAPAVAAPAAEPPSSRLLAGRTGEGKQPSYFTPYIARRMMMPRGVLDPYIIPALGGEPGLAPRVGVGVGTLWGITSGLHAELQLGPFYGSGIASDPHRLAFTGRLVNTPAFQMGASLSMWVDTNRGMRLDTVQPGLPMILELSGTRIDTGVHVPISNAGPGLRVPMNVYVQLSDHVHAGATSMIDVKALDDPQRTMTVPLGFTLGYSAAPEDGSFGLTPYFRWTEFYKPATGVVNTGTFVGGLVVDVPVRLP